MSLTSPTTNVPPIVFSTTGVSIPLDSAILAGRQADYNAAFSTNFNFSTTTPQGQIVDSETAIISDKNQQILNMVNMFDPSYATGRWQDALGKYYFLTRIGPQPTSVTVTLSGAPGQPIPAGTLALAQNGYYYSNSATVTIGSDGTAPADFQCTVNGPIECPAGTLNQVAQAIPGWDSITNPSDGVLGRLEETRAEFEVRRQESVAANSQGPVGAILSAVLAVPNVLDAYGYDNYTASAVTIGGVTIPAKSVYICASGGSADAIAAAIFSKKAPGCGYAGNTTITVFDTNSAFANPPAYNVSFETAVPLDFVATVQLSNNDGIPSNAASLISTAILAAFAGTDDYGVRIRIGDNALAARFYQGIQALGSWAQIDTLLIGTKDTPSAVFTASISGLTMTVTSVASGAILSNAVLNAAGLVSGTAIVSGPSGGGAGTYTLNLPNSVTSETVTAYNANETRVAVGISRAPTIATSDIAVMLV